MSHEVMNICGYRVIKGLKRPKSRDPRRGANVAALIELAKTMEAGDAAVLNNVEVGAFRYILAALGFCCATDSWRSTPELVQTNNPRALLVFKLNPPEIDYQI